MSESTIPEQGFLSIEIDSVRSQIAARYDAWRALVARVNRFCMEMQYSLQINRNLPELVAATLFGRTLSNVQAAVLLTDRGMEVQARVLLRAAIEALFTLRAVERDPGFASEFTNADHVQRKKMLRKAQRWTIPVARDRANQTATPEKLAEIEAAIKENNAKELLVATVAEKAGLMEWYLTAYAAFSSSVHSNIRDLEEHHLIIVDREIRGVRNEPSLDDLHELYLTALEVLLTAVSSVGRVFGLETEAFCAEQGAAIGTLFEQQGATEASRLVSES